VGAYFEISVFMGFPSGRERENKKIWVPKKKKNPFSLSLPEGKPIKKKKKMEEEEFRFVFTFDASSVTQIDFDMHTLTFSDGTTRNFFLSRLPRKTEVHVSKDDKMWYKSLEPTHKVDLVPPTKNGIFMNFTDRIPVAIMDDEREALYKAMKDVAKIEKDLIKDDLRLIKKIEKK